MQDVEWEMGINKYFGDPRSWEETEKRRRSFFSPIQNDIRALMSIDSCCEWVDGTLQSAASYPAHAPSLTTASMALWVIVDNTYTDRWVDDGCIIGSELFTDDLDRLPAASEWQQMEETVNKRCVHLCMCVCVCACVCVLSVCVCACAAIALCKTLAICSGPGDS